MDETEAKQPHGLSSRVMAVAPVRLGIIVPSSNTSLEPLTQAIVASISTPQRPVTVHFTRIPMTQLNLGSASAAQFSHEAFVAAAQLLVDAKVDAIGWSGTSAGWLGFAHDEKLYDLLKDLHDIPITTSTLALNRLLKLSRISRLGLVTPYTPDMNALIMANYATLGYPITPERARDMSITENHRIGAVDGETLTQMVREVVEAGADCVTTFCTNWNAAHLVEGWEREFGVPVFDSVSAVVWDLCRLVEVDMGGAGKWGRMFF